MIDQSHSDCSASTTLAEAPARISSPATIAARIYTTGTLRYTRAGLALLFLWLLWGDFCSTMFQGIFGNFLPLYLRSLDASNTLISFLVTGVSGAMNLLFLPNISMASDQYRGRWGRRIPFLFWSTPVAAFALISIGYSADIGAWLHTASGTMRTFSLAGVTLFIVITLVVIYELFLMITNNIYQFLLRDVVPQDVMPWFLAMFRMVGVTAGCLFQWFLFRYIVDHPKLLCMSVGIMYLLSFLLICWQVKEGRYGPPEPKSGSMLTGTLKNYIRYFRECFSVSIYRNYIFVYILMITGGTGTGSFVVLFGTKTLGLGMTDYGHVLAIGTLISGAIYLPMGYLCKHLSPMRVALASLVIMAMGPLAAYLLVWTKAGWLTYTVVMVLPNVGWALGSFTLMMLLFPKENFGQFSSSLMAIGWGSLALTSYLVGQLMDLVGSNYRVVFLVSLFCYALAIIPMINVYRGWKQAGGPNHYVPPMPASIGK